MKQFIFLLALVSSLIALVISSKLDKRGLEIDSASKKLIVVRQTNTNPGEYKSINDAIAALEQLKGPQKILIHPGVYSEQLRIKYKHPLKIQGYTTNPRSTNDNQVTIQVSISAASQGMNSKSATLWITSPNFKLSNVNLINSFGEGTDKQALALAAEGEKHSYNYCLFSSYQDTVYIKTLSSFFFGCQIEGAVDFIFGPGTAWFEASDIVVKTPKHHATITAQKREPGGNTIFVFNNSRVLPKDRSTPDGVAYLGRPWSSHAAVMFQLCYLSRVVNPLGWIQWSPESPQTENISFQEFNNRGPASDPKSRQLASIKSQPILIETILGPDYKDWIE